MSSHARLANTGTTLRLLDGRDLGYVESGDPTGSVLLYFHGHPGTRLEAGLLGDAATKHAVRLIGVDRPGLGLSDYKPGRRLLDWPDDVTQLADALHLDRFAVVGFSGGGPYALACAHALPQRLTACGLVSSAGQANRFFSFLALWAPWLILPTAKRSFRSLDRAEKLLTRVTRQRWPAPDQQAFASPHVRSVLIASLVDSFTQGTEGAARDGMLIGAHNWRFTLDSITAPTIHLWHGALDKQIPITQAQAIATQLAHVEPTFYPEDAHISTITNHADEIVAALVAVDPPANAPRQR